MDIFSAHRLLALAAVVKAHRYERIERRTPEGKEPRYPSGQLVPEPDHDYLLRRALREYSHRFHTPLHLVYELPLDFVLQHYFENAFEEAAARPQDERDADLRPYLDRLRDEASETAQERLERIRGEVSEDDLLRELREEADKLAEVVAEVEKKAPKTLQPGHLPESEMPTVSPPTPQPPALSIRIQDPED